MKIIRMTISPVINLEEEEIGWQEITNASVTYLIKSILSKGKEAGIMKISRLDDCSKLSKHIAVLFDKIAKGHAVILPA